MATSRDPHDVAAGVRRTPVQTRSQRTVEAIIESATELLVTEGLEGFNTNAIAARAGVGVSTLYGYFDDKHAVLRRIAEDLEAGRDAVLAERLAGFSAEDDWRRWAAQTIEALVAYRRAYPVGDQIRTAMQTIPEFRAMQQVNDERRAAALAGVLATRAGGASAEQVGAVARVALVANVHVLDWACRSGRVDQAMVAAHTAMLISLLGTVLD